MTYLELINDVLEAYVRNNTSPSASSPTDTSLTKIDRSAYAALPNKLSQGTPSQYYVQRTTSPSVFLYQTPGSGFSSSSTPSNFQLKFYYLARIEDGGRYTNTPDVVFRFLPCLTSGLAYYLSITYRPEKTEMLKLIYEDELQRALQEDGQRTSLFISPKTFYGDGAHREHGPCNVTHVERGGQARGGVQRDVEVAVLPRDDRVGHAWSPVPLG